MLIAKVLVISRLIHKALGQSKDQPPIVDQLWEKLLSARRKLLRRIDSRLSNTTVESLTLVESMCAYALATSSTPTDVLNHFLKVRLDRVNTELKGDKDHLGSLKWVSVGAAPLDAELEQVIEDKLGMPLMQGYGMSETTVAALGLQRGQRKGTVGWPVPGVEVCC